MTGVLVIGVGNAYRRDDGAGLAVARRLLGRRLPGVEVRTHGGDAAGLLDLWEGSASVVIVDAVRTGAAPGTIHRLDATAAALPRSWPLSSHGHGVASAAMLARALGRLPRALVVYGIEAGDLGDGAGLSPPAAAAVDEVVERIATEVRRPGPVEVPS